MFPTTLPRTEGRDVLIARLRGRTAPDLSDAVSDPPRSPTKGVVFADVGDAAHLKISSGTSNGLRELDVNVVSGLMDISAAGTADNGATAPPPQATKHKCVQPGEGKASQKEAG